MKKIIIIAVALLMVVGVGSAFAANSLERGKVGISVGMGDSIFGKVVPPDTITNPVVTISGRYFIARDMAITGGFGFQSDGGDADASFISVSAGFRKYLKTDDFAPFINGKFTYAKAKQDVAPTFEGDIKDFEASVGAEYFLGKQFSLEGAIGLGFGIATINDVDDTYFGTRTVGVNANFYF